MVDFIIKLPHFVILAPVCNKDYPTLYLTRLILAIYCVRCPHAMPFFQQQNALFSTEKLQKCMSFRGCIILNDLNLEKWRLKINNCTFLFVFLALFMLYCTHALIFWNKSCLTFLSGSANFCRDHQLQLEIKTEPAKLFYQKLLYFLSVIWLYHDKL